MLREYNKRIFSLLYYFLNKFKFKHLDFRAILFFSVKVDGKEFITIGRNSIIQRGGWLIVMKVLDQTPQLTIGDNCAIGDYCHISVVGNMNIEDDVLMANRVYISDNLHDYTNPHIPIHKQEILHKKDIVIGNGCWIGENVCIIGASIGRNSVIGANSVVTKDIGDYCIAVGSPARVIKRYNFKSGNWESV